MHTSFPDFIIIGAGKSGTTSLYYQLKQHPEVFIPEVKETNFFALQGEKLLSVEEDPDEMNYYPWSITEWDAYVKLFSKARSGQIKGEVSPMYLYHPNTIQNIKTYAPSVKIIAILRQPAERLYSRFQHLARDNRKPTENFEDALIEGNIWWQRNDLVQEGFFFKHLSKFYASFDPKQIKVFLYDDLKENPLKVIQSIYNFIGVEDSFQPELKTLYNASGEIKNKTLDKFIGRKSYIFSMVKNTFPGGYKLLKQNRFLKKKVNAARNKNLNKIPLSTESKSKVTALYNEDIEKLQNLIQRDLSSWMNL